MSFRASLREILSNYKTWIQQNPEKASDFETLFKWTSYFIAGRINKSMIPTEVMYTASSLLVLFNDRIVRSATEDVTHPASKLRLWLTTLEYCEVIIEISVKKIWGEKMKWLVIAAVQMAKFVLRLTLLLKYNTRLLPSPAISPLDRGRNTQENESQKISSVAFTLKSSGRVIRKVQASPTDRSWRPPVIEEDDSDEELDRGELTKHLAGEVVYMAKPLAHLWGLYKYGGTSWKPWLLSLSMDISSLILLRSAKRRNISKAERMELSHRTFHLVMYLLRSPFYEKHTSDRLNSFLKTLAHSLPLVRYLADPLREYLPYYQSTYSYVWST